MKFPPLKQATVTLSELKLEDWKRGERGLTMAGIQIQALPVEGRHESQVGPRGRVRGEMSDR
jgi:hypothetical protein